MNISYAHGGSEVVAPLGIALAGPVYGEALVYAELEAGMIKATKAIVDTIFSAVWDFGQPARHVRGGCPAYPADSLPHLVPHAPAP